MTSRPRAPGGRASTGPAGPPDETPFGLDEVDDEIVGVERTGAHDPLTDELTGGAVVIDAADLVERSVEIASLPAGSDELPAVLSSVSGGLEDEPTMAPGLLRGAETDRTAAYDPPPELFADIPDPEAADEPLPMVTETQAADIVPDLPGDDAPAVEISLFAPEPEPPPVAPRARPASGRVPAVEAVPTPAAHPVSAPAPAAAPVVPSSGPGRGQRAPKPHRPPGPMHRPIAAKPAPAPAPAPDPVENELTGIYEPPEVVPELARGKLTIVEGENRGKAYFLNRNRSMIGRGIDNDIVLMDIAVSRKHFRVDRHADGFRLVDLGSGNGTALNGKRVTEVELFDGDRIDVGNSTLEFVSVGRARERAATGTGTADPRGAPATDPGLRRPAVPTGAASPGAARIPWTWIGLWAAATFLAVVIVLVIVRRGRPDAGAESAAQAALAHVALAEAAVRARDWKRAEEEIGVARELGHGVEIEPRVDFDGFAARLVRERDAQRRLDEARRKVGVEPPAAVQALLLGIGRDSVYYTEARSLIAELDGLAEAARLGQGAPSAPPTSPGVAPAPPTSAPREIVQAPPRVEPAPRDPAPPTRPNVAATPAAGGGADDARARKEVSDALKLYQAERFDDAAAALEKAARRAPGTKTGKDAVSKARLVREFAEQWGAAQKALRSRRAREASDALGRAQSTDRRLGGHFRDRIDSQLAEQLYMVAIQAYNRQAYDEAIQANGRVLELQPGHALGTRLQSKMRSSAALVARQAQQALDNGDKETARRLAQAALRLVGESEPAGRSARKVLDKL
jgi:tetratricopeptide (TPR) repeat protein